MTLKILPEIEENLFPLKPEELNLLEESILSEGVRDALVVWPKDGELILVDAGITDTGSLRSITYRLRSRRSISMIWTK